MFVHSEQRRCFNVRERQQNKTKQNKRHTRGGKERVFPTNQHVRKWLEGIWGLFSFEGLYKCEAALTNNTNTRSVFFHILLKSRSQIPNWETTQLPLSPNRVTKGTGSWPRLATALVFMRWLRPSDGALLLLPFKQVQIKHQCQTEAVNRGLTRLVSGDLDFYFLFYCHYYTFYYIFATC